MTLRIPTLLLALLVLCLGGLAACGEREEPAAPGTPRAEPLRLVLDYFPNADHAGIYAAQARGDFERAGLDVEIIAPSDPSAPLKLVQAGRADLAISYQPELFLARDKGAELVAVGAIAQVPLTSLISLPAARIRSPEDLAGKTVGTAGIPYQSAYLKTILEEAGVDPARVREVNLGFNLVPGLLSRKVDAVLGAFWNYEGVQLERERRRPQIIRMEEVGVPTYQELILVAAEKTLNERGALVRRFLRALQDGTQAVREDPAAGVDPLLEANEELDRGLQTAVVRRTLPVFFPRDPERPFGWMENEEWQAYATWMQRNGLLEGQPTRQAFTNEFLPGEGVLPVEEEPGQQGDG